MTLDEYESSGRQLYEDFAKLVATLLSEHLNKRGEIKLQHVQHRAKGLQSLRDKLPNDDPLWSSVRVGLEATGVVSGEFGMAEAYKERRVAVAQWLEDADEKVRRFAKTHVAQLDRLIASEQRRADEDLEFRKRSWGTGTGDEKGS